MLAALLLVGGTGVLIDAAQPWLAMASLLVGWFGGVQLTAGRSATAR